MSTFDNLTEEEKAAIGQQNELLNQYTAAIFAKVFPTGTAGLPRVRYFKGLDAAAGQTVKWTNLPRSKNLYRHWIDRDTGRHYAYTPWKDDQGWYWAFNYTDAGPVTDAVKFRKRKAAKQRAADRYADAAGIARWKVGS